MNINYNELLNKSFNKINIIKVFINFIFIRNIQKILKKLMILF